MEPTGFVGRDDELKAVRTALERSPLVTLTGPGGVGKSRIALRVAHELYGRFPDGIGFVELSGLREERLLTGTVVGALGLDDGTTAATPERVAGALGGRRFLLVLDTCEHLVDACASFVRFLVTSCPELRVLVTGRQPLGTREEFVLHVPPLPLPAPGALRGEREALTGGDALTLFAERAAQAVPGFTLGPENLRDVALLCHRLDGIPLAIELAAAQLRSTPLERLVRQVDGLFWTLESAPGDEAADEDVRHRTLRTTVGWSHELCAPLERLLWARLAVFSGGFNLTMAIEVCADEQLGPDAVAECLSGLVEKSVVQRVSSSRYDMLDTIREYGAVWLEAVEDIGPLMARHYDCVARLATGAAAAWLSDDQLHWARRVDTERGNIHTALEYCFSTPGQEVAGLRLAVTLWGTWLSRGRYTEARHWLERGLSLVTEPIPERAEALWQCAYLLTNQGDSTGALPLIAEAAHIMRLDDDMPGYARTLRTLGTAAMFLGEAERAHRCFTEARQILVAHGLNWDLVLLHVLHAYLYVGLEEYDAALAECDEALRLLRNAPTECWLRSWAGYVKAVARMRLGDADGCVKELRACVERFRRMDDQTGLTNCYELLAWAYTRLHRYAEGALLLGAASRHEDTAKVPRLSALTPGNGLAELEARTREALGAGPFAEHRRRGRSLGVDELVRLARGEPLSL
ncbi:ATP-binding protein [Actinomadura sp. SCN-SB]|uniref:ATP-binding protein n=1 Tax=Actinomadura sp. SCN-SB TaxID=3373092 RepID=UPI0037515D23